MRMHYGTLEGQVPSRTCDWSWAEATSLKGFDAAWAEPEKELGLRKGAIVRKTDTAKHLGRRIEVWYGWDRIKGAEKVPSVEVLVVH